MSNSLESILNKKKSYVIAENGVLPPLDASQLRNLPIGSGVVSNANYASSAGSVEWENVNNKPSVFNPASHNHSAVQITDLNTNVSSIVSGMIGDIDVNNAEFASSANYASNAQFALNALYANNASGAEVADYAINAGQAEIAQFASSAGYAQEVGQHNHSAVQIIDLNANISSVVSNFKASSDAFGLVKVGEGINVSQGVISVDVGSLNESSNKVAHFDVMPNPESSVDEVVIYTGETDSSYNKGHVYKKEQSNINIEDTLIITVNENDYSDIAGTYHITSSKTITGEYYNEDDDNWIEVTITDIPIFENENNCILECFYDSEFAGTYWNISFNNNNFRQLAFIIPNNNDNDQNVESLINNISGVYEFTGQYYVAISITSIKSSGSSSSTIWNDITPDGGGLNRIITSSNVTAQNGNWYLCNANVTITLPASPTSGDVVKASSISSANNISIVPSGIDTIENQVGFVIDVENSSVELMYNGSMWVVSEVITKGIKTSNFTKSVLPIGTIFYHISNTPPEGAFLLNGQIIYNCSTLYPEFYQYITSNNNIRKITTSAYESELSSVGICGGFVVDAENGSIRLPNISSSFIENTNGSNAGNVVNAGLPNITGRVDNLMTSYNTAIENQGTGSLSMTAITAEGPAQNSNKQICRLFIDASGSSSVYGNSNTVQPKSVFYSVCIQVFNAATNLSTQVSAQLTSEMQNKVGINADNFTAIGKDKIVDTVFELVYNNDSIVYISAFNTYYQAQRTGFLEAVLLNSSANAVNCYLRVSNTMENTVISTGFSILGNNTTTGFNIIVPKGMYYYIGCANTSAITLQRARFIPFKNSISSNS